MSNAKPRLMQQSAAFKQLCGAACALVVMAKVPSAGRVKTRLVPPLTHAQAAEMGACLLRDTLAKAQLVAQKNNAVAVWCYAPPDVAPETLAEFAPAGFAHYLPQRGATLGARLKHAVADIYALGYETVCFIGADSPTVPEEFLASALAQLQNGGERVVIGPAEDGGYYLIGFRGQQVQLFDGIAWSTDAVFRQTLVRAEALRLPVNLLPVWYDVDNADGLRRLASETMSEAPHTRLYLQQLSF